MSIERIKEQLRYLLDLAAEKDVETYVKFYLERQPFEWNAYPLKPAESAALTLGRPKTTALCFDRVWRCNDRRIGFHTNSRLDIAANLYATAESLIRELEEDEDPGKTAVSEVLEAVRKHRKAWDYFIILDAMPSTPEEAMTVAEISLATFDQERQSRRWAEKLSVEADHLILPCYPFGSASETDYVAGEYQAVLSILSGLQVVSEDELSWEQVKEFRRDREARLQYRRLIHWMDANMVGKPLSFVEDDVALRLDGYEHALRKH